MEKSNVTPLVPKDKTSKENENLVSSLSPREIVSELDRFVVGQNKAKKAVAVALRNRWRRQALKGEMKNEVLPKNILMIGPTGVGKTEISRRLSKLAEAPFVKVEATRFTEVGYVGRDVEQIVRDLIEIAISMEKIKKRKEVYAQAQKMAEEKVLDALVGKKASLATREAQSLSCSNSLTICSAAKNSWNVKCANLYLSRPRSVNHEMSGSLPLCAASEIVCHASRAASASSSD